MARASLALSALALAAAFGGALAAPPALHAQNDGALDTAFGGGDGVVHLHLTGGEYGVTGLHVDPDGGFTVAGGIDFGTASYFDFDSCLLGRNGGVQDCTSFSFDLGGNEEDFPRGGVAYQLDGRRVLAGAVAGTDADPDPRVGLLQLDATNVLDAAFGNGGRKVINYDGEASANAVATRRNGDVVISGGYDHEVTLPGSGYDCLVGRLHEDGTLDTSFSGNGLATVGWDLGAGNDDVCSALALYPDGRVAVAGRVERSDGSEDFGIARLTAAGALDTSFSGNGKDIVAFDQGGGDLDEADVIALDRKERIVVAGIVTTPGGQRAGVARLGPGGALDTSFAGTGKLSFSISGTRDDVVEVNGLVVLSPPSNDILISGVYETAQSDLDGFVVALHADGSFDSSFSGDGIQTLTVPGATADLSRCFLALQGGKVLVAGSWGPLAPEVGDLWVERLSMHQIFGDDFESGDLRLWSNHADP